MSYLLRKPRFETWSLYVRYNAIERSSKPLSMVQSGWVSILSKAILPLWDSWWGPGFSRPSVRKRAGNCSLKSRVWILRTDWGLEMLLERFFVQRCSKVYYDRQALKWSYVLWQFSQLFLDTGFNGLHLIPGSRCLGWKIQFFQHSSLKESQKLDNPAPGVWLQ